MNAIILILVLAALVAAVAGALVLGTRRWEAGTQKLRSRIEAAQLRVLGEPFAFRDVDDLPTPVQRYFRTALRDGQPMISKARLRHRGTFNMDPSGNRWRPFTSDQFVITRRPGFDWNARIAIAPGLAVRVHDAYVAGKGILEASLHGLLPLAKLHGGRELAEGELMRFLAEAVWYPTALLPGQGIRWKAVNGHSAKATLQDEDVSATLLFTFADSGLVESVRAETRGRMVKGEFQPTPWEGRFWNYTESQGVQVPLEGEVSWAPSGESRPYWRGLITEIRYA